MEKTGTMSITELWSQKEKKKFLSIMAKDSKIVKIVNDNLTNNIYYKPEKIEAQR